MRFQRKYIPFFIYQQLWATVSASAFKQYFRSINKLLLCINLCSQTSFTLRFTCGNREIWQKVSRNIIFRRDGLKNCSINFRKSPDIPAKISTMNCNFNCSLQLSENQKQPSRGVHRKRCSENMKQIYRTLMPKCDFDKVVLQLY